MNIEEANDNLLMLKYFLQEEGDENWEKYCEAIETLLTAYEKSKGVEEKIKNYLNIIQKELDKYKIKNTNTYIQIEGNPEINGLLIQKATLEELIKELEKE